MKNKSYSKVKTKVMLISIKDTSNLGDIGISEMIEHFFEVTGTKVHHLEFNFRSQFKQILKDIARQDQLDFIEKIINKNLLLVKLMLAPIYFLTAAVQFSKKSKEVDAVFIGGGNLLMGSVIGFPIQVLFYSMLSKFFKKRLVFFSVGVGPLSVSAKPLIRLSLNMADIIICRDTVSRMVIHNTLGINKEIKVVPDPVLLFPLSKFEKSPSYDVLLNVAFLEGSADKSQNYIESIVTLVLDLIKQRKSVALFDTESDDGIFTQNIQYQVFCASGIKVDFFQPKTTDELVRLIHKADCIFSSRMHAAIFSFSQLIPSINVVWQSKVSALYKDQELSELLIAINKDGSLDVGSIILLIDQIKKNRMRYARKLKSNKKITSLIYNEFFTCKEY